MPDDPNLLSAFARTGSPEAFRDLVGRHIDLVYAAARRQTHDSHDAEDITQAVFIILAQKARAVPSAALLPAWLLKITHFAAADCRRSAARRQKHEQEAAAMLPTTAPEPDPEWDRISPHLDAALAHLSPTDRAAVIAHCLQNRSIAQIAASLNLSEPAARKRVQRALQRLRALLEPKVPELRTPNSKLSLALPALLATHALAPAPSALAATITTTALAALHGTLATTTALTLSKGVMHMMFLAKAKLGLVVALVIIVLTTITGTAVHFAVAQASAPAVTSAPAATIPTTTVATTIPSTLGKDTTRIVAPLLLDARTQRMDKWWGDLEGMEPGVSRAALGLAGTPAETVAFFKGKIVPLKISDSEVRSLIENLGSDQDRVWRPAFENLEYFDPRLAIALTTLMDEVKEQPARNRLVAVLSWESEAMLKETAGMTISLQPLRGSKVDYNFAGKTADGKRSLSWWAESQVGRLTSDRIITKKQWVRADRAILLLSQIRTPEAREMVNAMADGHPDAEPTKTAKAVLADSATAATQPIQNQMEQWWMDMEKPGLVGLKAMMSFSGQPEEAVKFFKGRLLPLKITEEELNKLVEALGSDRQEVWKPAFAKLEYFDPRLAVGLEPLLRNIEDGPQRTRLVEVLCDARAGAFTGRNKIALQHLGKDYYNFAGGTGSWPAESLVSRLNASNSGAAKRQWLRATRAIVLLAHIGTPEAMGMVKEMATGHPEAQPTGVAKEELVGK